MSWHTHILIFLIAAILSGCSNLFDRPEMTISEFKAQYLPEFTGAEEAVLELLQRRTVGGAIYIARLADVDAVTDTYARLENLKRTENSTVVRALLANSFESISDTKPIPAWLVFDKEDKLYSLAESPDGFGRTFYLCSAPNRAIIVVWEK